MRMLLSEQGKAYQQRLAAERKAFNSGWARLLARSSNALYFSHKRPTEQAIEQIQKSAEEISIILLRVKEFSDASKHMLSTPECERAGNEACNLWETYYVHSMSFMDAIIPDGFWGPIHLSQIHDHMHSGNFACPEQSKKEVWDRLRDAKNAFRWMQDAVFFDPATQQHAEKLHHVYFFQHAPIDHALRYYIARKDAEFRVVRSLFPNHNGPEEDAADLAQTRTIQLLEHFHDHLRPGTFRLLGKYASIPPGGWTQASKYVLS